MGIVWKFFASVSMGGKKWVMTKIAWSILSMMLLIKEKGKR